MEQDALTTFIARTREAFGPITSELVSRVQTDLQELARAPANEAWLAALHAESPASRELYRDPEHKFLLLAHAEPNGLYRPPHDHGQSWVVYALSRGEMEISTYARVEDARGVRLVRRDTTRLRAGEARPYLPGDIHDTRCLTESTLLFRFTARDLKLEERAQRLTRYVERAGVWTVGNP